MFETKDGVIKPIVYVGIVQNNRILLVNYKVAPNPEKKGWWLPAPDLEFGEDPLEKARFVLSDFGLTAQSVRLHGVESFVTPGGWHLIYHYIAEVQGEVVANRNLQAHQWLNEKELLDLIFAHGSWEAAAAKSFLQRP